MLLWHKQNLCLNNSSSFTCVGLIFIFVLWKCYDTMKFTHSNVKTKLVVEWFCCFGWNLYIFSLLNVTMKIRFIVNFCVVYYVSHKSEYQERGDNKMNYFQICQSLCWDKDINMKYIKQMFYIFHIQKLFHICNSKVFLTLLQKGWFGFLP
jgi:hypothetical protein